MEVRLSPKEQASVSYVEHAKRLRELAFARGIDPDRPFVIRNDFTTRDLVFEQADE